MFEQAQGDGGGQGSLACYSPWGCKESDTTEKQQFPLVGILVKLYLLSLKRFLILTFVTIFH